MGIPRRASIFEFGCGAGLFLHCMSNGGENTAELGGVDFSEFLIKEASRFLPGAELLCAEAIDCPREPQYDFRTKEFSELMLSLEAMLKQAVGAPDDAKVIFLTCSGTGAMEATLLNCCSPTSKILIINGGQFAGYFINICESLNLHYDLVNIQYWEKLEEKHLLPFEGKGYDFLCVNIHETSTGQLYDKCMLAEFCRRNSMYLIVDAISSILADEYDVRKHAIDATILSSQKGFSSAPGLSMVVLSRRLFDEKVLPSQRRSYYFDFKNYAENILRGQTPFTPAIGVILQLKDILDFLLDYGIERYVAHTNSLATLFRSQARRIGLHIPDIPLSNAITPVIMKPEIDAYKVHLALMNDFSLMVNPSGVDHGRIFRVGHLGNLTKADINLLTASLEKTLASMDLKK